MKRGNFILFANTISIVLIFIFIAMIFLTPIKEGYVFLCSWGIGIFSFINVLKLFS